MSLAFRIPTTRACLLVGCSSGRGRLRRVAPGSTTGKGGSAAVGGGGGTSAGGGGGSSGGVDAGADRPIITIDAGPDGGGCTPTVTCTPPNGRYCGMIGNGCFGTTDCGALPQRRGVRVGVCVGGASCVPLVCQVAAGKYCGTVGDGCGRRWIAAAVRAARPAAPRACA